ncbi:hypothetical protein [uncultured Sanguibacteroides sp.]|uniref:hypothetical protein n=1 Tax=uncultured Sanguibacteroides sp. TaxID=1635151 RepID=UPI0025D6B63C|nr:hypothetical protein [uncultured Sanguibacteroides sp.]
MEKKIVNRRVTLFARVPIIIDEHTLPKFVEAFSGLGLLPSVNKGLGLRLTPQGVIQENVISLEMKYLDDTLKVSIGADRFDIIDTQKNESMDIFMHKVREIIVAISKVYLDVFTRLALCTTVIFDMDIFLLNKIYQKIINTQDENPVEWQIRKVLRTKLEQKDELIINNVYTLSRNMMQIGVEPPVDRIMLDIDINTIVGSDVNILKQSEKDFWKIATQTIEKAINEYTDLILHD